MNREKLSSCSTASMLSNGLDYSIHDEQHGQLTDGMLT